MSDSNQPGRREHDNRIAAADDLYEALKGLLGVTIHRVSPVLETKALAALAKADGK